ncbi:Panacea domain-containing protein [uncultured Adlercreutzia sp.]|uniref:Panacea domain-containing protein n=1 Tax=uncultured Adlercreutzia sp. TaxID=875803 RepID=UPI002674B5A7|nr:Panacea domain-containing protein [uncultured Adlercreutzia sp.]
MAHVVDVAAYILEELGTVSTMKLQKLAFYSQAYYLVEHGAPLFPEEFEAWANGPVAPDLFRRHRGEFVITRGFFGPVREAALSEDECEAVDHVVGRLKGWSGAQLSDLTHSEAPWQAARTGLAPNARSQRPIEIDFMRACYETRPAANPVFA